MDKLEAMRVFLAVADEGSFVAASRQLDLSAPAVTRTIAHLEQTLGIRLFHRTTRRVRLTEAGERYKEDTKRILEEIRQADANAAGIYSEPRGTLTVTAPELFGQLHVLPIITDYLQDNPAVTINALFFDRVSNLLEEGLDVAIRIGELKDSSLYAVEVGSVCRVLCAAPDYLHQHGTPKSPSDLTKHEVIMANTLENSTNWHFEAPAPNSSVRVSPRLHCSQVGAAVDAAVGGLGVVRLMSYQVGEELKRGSLKRLLPEYEPKPLPVNIVYLAGRHANAKVRSFVDAAATRLRANPFIQH